MSFAQLQSYYLTPRLTARSYIRGLRKSCIRTHKAAKAKKRQAKSIAMAFSRRQYFLSTAYVDLRKASRQNEDIVIMSVVSVVVLAFAAAATSAEILLNFFITAFILSESTSMSLLYITAGSFTALAVLYGWFSAFLLNLISISIMDGATRKVVRSVRLTFRKSLALASRIATVWLMLLCIVAVPILAAATVSYVAIQFMNASFYELLFLAQIGIIGAVIWLLYVLLQYSLAPYVALFEPDKPLGDTFTRSRQLVQKKGRLFILAAYAALALSLLSAYIISKYIESLLFLEKWLAFTFFALPIALLFNGVLVMLYRKRRLARKY